MTTNKTIAFMLSEADVVYLNRKPRSEAAKTVIGAMALELRQMAPDAWNHIVNNLHQEMAQNNQAQKAQEN